MPIPEASRSFFGRRTGQRQEVVQLSASVVGGSPVPLQLARGNTSATAAHALTVVSKPAGVASCRELRERIRSTVGPASRLPSASRSATMPVTSAVARELPEAKS